MHCRPRPPIYDDSNISRIDFLGIQGKGYLQISAYRASYAVGFSKLREKNRNFDLCVDNDARASLCLRLLSGLRPDRLRFGFAADRGRFDRNKIQDQECFETTTRPPNRGRSS